MTNKQIRLDVLTDARNWWNNKDRANQYKFCMEYYQQFLETTQRDFTEISVRQIVYMFLLGNIYVKLNKMTATEARNKVKESTISYIDEIYSNINKAVNFGCHNCFISNFNITKEDKEILEKNGFFVSTRNTKGFQVRWYENDKDYFLSQVLKQDNYYLKTDSIVIENYMKLQEF